MFLSDCCRFKEHDKNEIEQNEIILKEGVKELCTI